MGGLYVVMDGRRLLNGSDFYYQRLRDAQEAAERAVAETEAKLHPLRDKSLD